MFKEDLIIRPLYIEKIKPFINLKMIKIISGVRRCGKSYILEMISDELRKENINSDHIIYRLYTSIEVADGFSKMDMYNELKSKIIDNNKFYLLLDEVQEVDEWEQAINTLFENYNVDIYVTGSNSKLTSQHISTYLSGRYIIIPTFTLSFEEYLLFKHSNNTDIYSLFDSYFREGGFPIIAINKFNYEQSYQILNGIYNSIICKDVLTKHPMKEYDRFERVLKYILNNIGNTFSANSIYMYYKSQQRNISVEQIYDYLKWLEDCFIIYRCNRMNLKGKEILKTQEKFYLADPSILFAVFSYNNSMDNGILENIVFLELKRRGYETYVGKIDDKEIDFIATKNGEEIDIQVAVSIPKSSNREIDNFILLNNNNHKYIVTMDKNDEQVINGIKVIHVANFLLMKNW